MRVTAWGTARSLLAAAACLPALAGCGNKHQTYPVEGTVVWDDGRPATDLAGGFVTLDSAALMISAQGAIRPDGTFVLGTYKQTDGVPAGDYRVVVNPSPMVEVGHPAPPLPHRYENVEKSGLRVTVEPKPNTVTLRVEKSKKKVQHKPTSD